MTLQSSFDLDIMVKITTRTSQTIIDVRGLEEVFSLLHYSILALILSFLTITGKEMDKTINWFIEYIAWLKIGLFFSFSIGKGLCRELVAIAT